MKQRLDHALVSQKLVPSRSKATDFIKRGFILVNGSVVTEQAHMVSSTDTITTLNLPQYVSRGGEKLEHALKIWNIDVSNIAALDIGSSTGGFTDCLLKHNITSVACIDTGTDQLHQDIRNNTKVTVYENTDIRNFNIEKRFDIIVIDVSFISLTHILPVLKKYTKTNTDIIALIKPQFEVGAENLNRKGIVKEGCDVSPVFEILKQAATQEGFKTQDIIPSPIQGGDGNQEYLWYIRSQFACI